MKTSRRHGAMVGACVGAVGLVGLAIAHAVAVDGRALPGPAWIALLALIVGAAEAGIDAWTRRPRRGAREAFLATLTATVFTALVWNAVADVFARPGTLLGAAFGVGLAFGVPLAHDAWALRRGPPDTRLETALHLGWDLVLPLLAAMASLLLALGVAWLDRVGAPVGPRALGVTWTLAVVSVPAALLVGAPLGLTLGLLRLVRPTDPARVVRARAGA